MPIEDRRSILRQSIGITGVFGMGLVLGWPLATIGAVFAALFLQAPVGMTIQATAKLAGTAFLLIVIAWILSSILAPYPIVFLGAVCFAIYLSFAWSVHGAGLLPGVLALMAALMLPNIVLQSSSLGWVLVVWIPMNIAIAGIVSGLMFRLIPAQTPLVAAKESVMKVEFDQHRRIVRMSLVTIPFAVIFFTSGASALLTLFFVAILSQQLAAVPKSGKTVAKMMLTANVLGAGISIACYEFTVMAPHIVTPVLVCFLSCLFLVELAKSEHRLAGASSSAMTTFLILFGGSIAPFADDVDVQAITRIIQIGSAAGFVILAYFVVDEFWPERRNEAAF